MVMTRVQRANETPYLVGLRKGRHNERKRVLAILRARLDPYDDDANESLLSAIKKIQGRKR